MGAEASRPVDWKARARHLANLTASDGVNAFFNRTRELQHLLNWLSEPPQSVQVLIGPNDSGKTRLLRRLQELWESNDYLAATSPLFYFDLRKLGWGTPQDAADHLMRAFTGWAQRFRAWASKASSGISLKVPGVEVQMNNIMGNLFGDVRSKSDLAVVMMRFADVVDANPEAFPIIILDEADRLKDWDPKDIRTLMGCFKSLIKQDNRAYLLLSSSDDFFRHWLLKDMFHPGQWNPVGVGFFTKDEAYQFFTGYCVPGVQGTLPQDFTLSDWPGVYDICGGSPVLLKQCAATAARWKLTWRVSAETLRSDCISRVETGLAAQLNNEGFDGHKYRQIVMAIVKDEFIGVRRAIIEVFDKDSEQCKAQLFAMLHGNFIHVRYVTARTLYADIEPGRIGNEFELIMARSPADRAAMMECLSELD